MRIESVDTAIYLVPRQPGLSSASARIESTSLILAKIQSDDGLEGIGWTYSHGTSGLAMKEAIDTLFAQRLVDQRWLILGDLNAEPKHLATLRD